MWTMYGQKLPLCLLFAEPPRVSVVPKNQSFTVGSEVSIMCSTTGHPKPKIAWTLNDMFLIGSHRYWNCPSISAFTKYAVSGAYNNPLPETQTPELWIFLHLVQGHLRLKDYMFVYLELLVSRTSQLQWWDRTIGQQGQHLLWTWLTWVWSLAFHGAPPLRISRSKPWKSSDVVQKFKIK